MSEKNYTKIQCRLPLSRNQFRIQSLELSNDFLVGILVIRFNLVEDHDARCRALGGAGRTKAFLGRNINVRNLHVFAQNRNVADNIDGRDITGNHDET